jgi:hypothetical protein
MIDLQASDGEGVLAAEGRNFTHYVDVDRAILRAKLEPPVTLDRTEIAADGEDAAVLTDIPAGSVVRIDGRPVEHDGPLELIATLPGEHQIEITHPRYLTWRTTIRAA